MKIKCLFLVFVFLFSFTFSFAQTTPKVRANEKDPSYDVELGYAVFNDFKRRGLKLLEDEKVQNYIDNLGARLVEQIPQEYQHEEFEYKFFVVDITGYNAFALPGGLVFINRDVIEECTSEAQLAGIMAHEISHSALRQSTAKRSAWPSILKVGVIVGASIVGGKTGAYTALGGLWAMHLNDLKYSREDEEQADLLGIIIMSRARYSPMGLRNSFLYIGKTYGTVPSWLSSHPNADKRAETIKDEYNLMVEKGIYVPSTGRKWTPELEEVQGIIKKTKKKK